MKQDKMYLADPVEIQNMKGYSTTIENDNCKLYIWKGFVYQLLPIDEVEVYESLHPEEYPDNMELMLANALKYTTVQDNDLQRFKELISEGVEGYDLDTILQNLSTDDILNVVKEYVIECITVSLQGEKIIVL